MTTRDEPDLVFLSLTHLRSASPDAERDARIRSHCHAVLARRAGMRAQTSRSNAAITRLGSLALAAVLCAYAAVLLLEALRLKAAL